MMNLPTTISLIMFQKDCLAVQMCNTGIVFCWCILKIMFKPSSNPDDYICDIKSPWLIPVTHLYKSSPRRVNHTTLYIGLAVLLLILTEHFLEIYYFALRKNILPLKICKNLLV